MRATSEGYNDLYVCRGRPYRAATQYCYHKFVSNCCCIFVIEICISERLLVFVRECETWVGSLWKCLGVECCGHVFSMALINVQASPLPPMSFLQMFLWFVSWFNCFLCEFIGLHRCSMDLHCFCYAFDRISKTFIDCVSFSLISYWFSLVRIDVDQMYIALHGFT